jgi:hypothetical protein
MMISEPPVLANHPRYCGNIPNDSTTVVMAAYLGTVHLTAKSSQVPVTPPWHDKHLGCRLPGALTVDTDDLGPAPSEVQ